jgi:hypothetical protein
LQVILFCAEHNLALTVRASNGKTVNPNVGDFLDIMEIISNHNTALNEMISKPRSDSVNYLSNKIQNEFISLLGKKVQAETISEIKKAKYVFIVLGMYPVVFHQEQTSQIIQYVNVTDRMVCINEIFIDFIHAHENTGSGLGSQILPKLLLDGTGENARGQAYDNSVNMASKYNGMRGNILQQN